MRLKKKKKRCESMTGPFGYKHQTLKNHKTQISINQMLNDEIEKTKLITKKKGSKEKITSKIMRTKLKKTN
jgi:hypothetical protein